MFYLYHHNDLSRLAELLGALRDRNRPSPLAQDTVLTPNRGIGRWLSIQIAESEGVVANLRNDLPGEWFWRLIGDVLPDARQAARHFEPDALIWHLYRALPGMRDSIIEIADYLGDPVDDIRRWQLAGRLADVFDRYLIYRADMLSRWQRDDGSAGPGVASWQAAVWRYLVNDYGLGDMHRARLLGDFVTRLQRDSAFADKVSAACPPRIYCFGLVALAPDHLRVLYALAAHIDVHFLLPNPSSEYWGDVTARRLPLLLPDDIHTLPGEQRAAEDHPLLEAFGRMARDTLRLLYSDEFTGMIEPELGPVMDYHCPDDDSLLHRVQADIVALAARDSDAGMTTDDHSLEIHACHSPLREIQVLQDQLLDRLAHDDTLAPRDILVMLPTVADYAPAIQAVFGGARDGRYLPFSLADRARAGLHPIVSCIGDLLDLPLWRWEASQLLDLLAVPAVRRRFGLTEASIDTVTRWAGDAGIRWGRDAAHRAELAAGEFEQNTWRFGLDRLLLGVAQIDENTLIDGVAPWSDLEGGATHALGGLWRFERTLARYARELMEAATPREWQARLNALVDDLIAPERESPDEARAVDVLRDVFAQFENAESVFNAIDTSHGTQIGWPAVRDMLRGALDETSERQPFLSGGITFCGLVPLRAVPFRVVCVLGLNDHAFPRQEAARSFNVMFDAPRLGDRDRRDDDRLLFLQALTAARDALYLSYIGQDVRSGEELPPSPVVGEMLAFVHRHYFRGWPESAFRKRLVHHQPMQPFSERYFSTDEPDDRVFTYGRGWRDGTQAAMAERGAPPSLLDGTRAPLPEPIQAIDLPTLKRFFDDPPKRFFRNRLGIDLTEYDDAVDDEEPLELDNLAQAALRRWLFDTAVSDGGNDVAEHPGPLELARGVLPPPPKATTVHAAHAALVNELLPLHRAWRADADPAEPAEINLDIDGVRLTGQVEAVGARFLRRLRPGRIKNKYRLRYWIDYLAVVAAGHAVTLQMAGFDKKSKKYVPIALTATINAKQARDALAVLIKAFIEGQQAPLAFHPDLADDYKPTEDNAFDNLAHRFKADTDDRQQHHLINDPHFALLLSGDAPLGENEDSSPFIDALETIWQPMNNALAPMDLPVEDDEAAE